MRFIALLFVGAIVADAPVLFAEGAILAPPPAGFGPLNAASLSSIPNPCAFALMRPPPRLTNGKLTIVGAKPCTTGAIGIWAVQPEETDAGFVIPVEFSNRHFEMQSFKASDLEDGLNSETRTGKFLKHIADATRPGGTIVIDRDTAIDGSLLIKYSKGTKFVVQRGSDFERFDRNMKFLRTRRRSSNLTVFDFSPTSMGALADFRLNMTTLSGWREFSKRIANSLSGLGRERYRGPRTVAAFFERLADPKGGMVLIYAHSDGESIFLDTDEGIRRITAEDLKIRFKNNEQALCPVILANCQTRPALASAFLEAGCPFVATADTQLYIDDIANLVKEMVELVHDQGWDVIDAYYAAHSAKGLDRLWPVAARLRIRFYFLHGTQIQRLST